MKPVICIPCGRRRYLSILLPHLLRERASYDRIHLWMNQCHEKEADRAWLLDVVSRYPDVLHPIYVGEPQPGHLFHQQYYGTCTEPDTVYIKIDDDIVWMCPGAIDRLMETRLAHPDAFMVLGNTVNNTWSNYWHGLNGVYPDAPWDPQVGFFGGDPYSRKDIPFAHEIHLRFLAAVHDPVAHAKYYFEDQHVDGFAQIHVISWFGRLLQDASGVTIPPVTTQTEERTFTEGRNNVFCGRTLFVHYAGTYQREALDAAPYLEAYRALAPEWP